MVLDLEQQILKVLRGTTNSGDRPVTLGELSRRLGVSSQLIAGCTRRMVRHGTAQPSIITMDGVPTLHGLLSQPPGPALPRP